MKSISHLKSIKFFALLFACIGLSAQDSFIEEVFVTAEKRSESLQDISQAVTAISDEDIENKNITSFVDLSASPVAFCPQKDSL